ncbi:hypothetical protein JFL43_15595 [Viridibacillus sp. YIM B01967]|jgi:hypothetical protein|uniref:Uncharacterized protein n=1 Tax=Viridibacillus soli TaxID=2798301 RepID=A0ABS1HA25_9BACL|nr:hypothetical protein [Viridibacillus soli]MBK3496260.1 hypothetical protein [Viridibacillus soli]
MEENKFAQLDREQMQELNELEEKFGVTLIAYDTAAALSDTSKTFNTSSSKINSS